ncbi:MAG: deoxyribose-phosphate aldolase [Desulfobacteraceae bacterium]|nr:deoxyribose-phosphate aldolase [Desulfobacteraceae bacterium]
MKAKALAQYFDHTILNPAATKKDVKQICKEAIDHGFFSVCVNPFYVGLVSKYLTRSEVKTCAVVGFPLGANNFEAKAFEAKIAVEKGAEEIDMVLNIGALMDNDFLTVKADIQSVVTAAKGNVVKVIIETFLLNREQKIKACNLAREAGAHFVKTSTGFAGGGATCEDVALMRETIGVDMKIKASGGIKTLEDTLKLIDAGADRIGASAGAAIIKSMG